MELSYLISCIVLCGASGLLGYILGHREGTLEGFLNGAIAVLTANDDFLAYNSKLVKNMLESAEDEDDDSPDYSDDP